MNESKLYEQNNFPMIFKIIFLNSILLIIPPILVFKWFQISKFLSLAFRHKNGVIEPRYIAKEKKLKITTKPPTIDMCRCLENFL